MFQVESIQGVTILTPDVVRMTLARSETIVNYCKTELAETCKAFPIIGKDGLCTSVELWAGDETQQKVLMQNLETEIHN